ncbi:MAG: PA0069 family radical SAM protein [Hyphomicrobiales bacterium]|nr:PA0069 family radical SAM protein [Hyphomicrobiales bacterium]MCP5371787.1 PA0069 family radical SAM protein [Hyphomicrobiales bacterium]
MVDIVPPRPRKGRGAVSNPDGRFEPTTRHAVDDGWGQWEGQWEGVKEDHVPPLRTVVTDERPKRILSRNTSPDVPFDRSINPYRGCEHGCVYCFARPTHAYMGLSPGLDFESRLFAKPDAPALLAEELRAPGYACAPVTLGANTDPYQPLERRRGITRGLLQVLAAHDHPVIVVTKSDLVLRDLDILGPMAARGLVSVGVSVTTLDPDLARTMEPRAASPAKRLGAIRALALAGVPVTALVAPVIPFVNDAEVEGVLEAVAAAGARRANYILLRLPLELKELVAEWLEAHQPGKAKRVMSMLRRSRGGQLYVAEWGTRMRGTGTWAELLEKRFALACRRHGLAFGHADGDGLDCGRFKVPPRPGDQLSLL